jgi:hypothetical protein
MDVLREREVKDSLERQLQDEQKVRGEYDMRSSWRHARLQPRQHLPRSASACPERISGFHLGLLIDRSRSPRDAAYAAKIPAYRVIPRQGSSPYC